MICFGGNKKSILPQNYLHHFRRICLSCSFISKQCKNQKLHRNPLALLLSRSNQCYYSFQINHLTFFQLLALKSIKTKTKVENSSRNSSKSFVIFFFLFEVFFFNFPFFSRFFKAQDYSHLNITNVKNKLRLFSDAIDEEISNKRRWKKRKKSEKSRNCARSG